MMVESAQTFLEVMSGTEPGRPFSEHVNRECADFMKKNASYFRTVEEIRDNDIFKALLHASNPRFPYVVPAMHALSKCAPLLIVNVSSSISHMLPFSKAWFFAFSPVDKDQLISAYVEFLDIFDTTILLPSQADKSLFTEVLTTYTEELNRLYSSVLTRFHNHIPAHSHHTVDKDGKPAQPMLVNSVGSVVKDDSEPLVDFSEAIQKAKVIVTAPRALSHVVKSIRSKFSQLSFSVPPHSHKWYSESSKKEFTSQTLFKEIQIASVVPTKKGEEPEYVLVPIWKLRQEMQNWTPGPLVDHSHYILSGSTRKDYVIVGITSTFAIGKVKN